jgi:transposase
MDYFAGLDVSVKDTSVCVVDDTGKITREVRVASEPDALLAVLRNPTYRFKRIGLEAGALSQWLFSALAEADLPAKGQKRTLRCVQPLSALPPRADIAERD